MTNTIFISLGSSPVAWYRCALPAHEIGADWIGVPSGKGPRGIIAGNLEEEPNFDDYEVIIIQQPVAEPWMEAIKGWQDEGKKVIYEVDDFLHGIHKIKEHRFQKAFHKKIIKKYVECMKQCDAMICSTEFLSQQYKKYNPNQHVCRLGIDTQRYDIEFPKKNHIVIGWAGGDGHHHAIGPWLQEVYKILGLYEDVAFVSIGTRYGDILNNSYPGRGLSIPWVSIENYPFTLTNLDIVMAPAHESKYYKSKSDLRWLEASAVGIPVVADPSIYGEIENDKTGIFASNAADAADSIMELIGDEDMRKSISTEAKAYVQKNRDISIMAEQWKTVIETVLS